MALILPKYLVNGYSKYMVPTCPVELDTTHPLALNLTCAYIPGSQYGLSDVAQQLGPILAFNNPGYEIGPELLGPAILGSPAGNVNFSTGASALASSALISKASGAGTIFVLAQFNADNDSNNLGVPLLGFVSGGGRGGPALAFAATSPGNIFFWMSSGNYGSFSATFPYPSLQALVLSYDASGNYSFYQNGILMASGNAGSSPSVSAGASLFLNGRNSSIGSAQHIYMAGLACGCMWSATDAASFAAKPFAMLRPVKSKLWFFPSVAVSGALSGMLSGQDTTSAALSGKGSLTGSLLGADSTTATLKGFSNSIGSAAGTDSTVGTLSSLNSLSGTLFGANSSSGTLSGKGSLSGTITGTDSTTGTVAGTVLVSGTLSGSDSSSGTLSNKISGYITGSVSGSDNTVSTLSGIGKLAGDISGISNLYIRGNGFGHQLTTTGAG